MAPATEAPASITAEGPTSHTQMQAAQLNEQQIGFLLSGINANRIGRDGKGFSHVEAWDIRRHLIRVFGFGGFDTDLLGMELVAQIDTPPDRPNGKIRYTVVYRVAIKLTVKVDGVELGHWHGAAIGDATNQPALGDAHDLALKTADSQALKRAAVNMGDQFGLSLYNNGSLEPVVNRSLAYMKPQEAPKLPVDPPVQPEPGSQQNPEPTTPSTPPVKAPTAPEPAAPQGSQEMFDKLWEQTQRCWDNPIALLQIHTKVLETNLGPRRVQGPDGTWTTFGDLLSTRTDELNQQPAQNAATERSAA
ncbi:Rad52/Rad22 family DNA repair protein [Streptomyces sp. NPDC056169]|uniref:Rad52/Rad22 family DNA repair protein n=1 Tax=Streptomyces sp. NPDC056169 TaxID=3345734 RepID=UPI0035D72AE9